MRTILLCGGGGGGRVYPPRIAYSPRKDIGPETPTPPEWLTHAPENITFPQLLLRAVKMKNINSHFNILSVHSSDYLTTAHYSQKKTDCSATVKTGV